MLQSARHRHKLWLPVLAAVVLSLDGVSTEAHKAVTSRFTYNEDIFPILRDNCGGCHVEGGPAPMGLLAWNDGPNSATPWAESIRELIISEQMPPWYVDSKGPAVRGGYGLTAVESDKLLTWATGGTPQGDLNKQLGNLTYQPRWSAGTPDLKLTMPTAYTVPAGTESETREFVISTGLSEERWVKAVDLQPGAPSIVRNATVTLDNGTVLTVWVPGDNLVTAPENTAFRLPPNTRLHLQIHYKKQWQNNGKAITDRSTIGLYFATAPPTNGEIRSFAIDSPNSKGSITFGKSLPDGARVIAVRPSLDRVYGTLTIQAVTPSGSRIPLLRLRTPRPEWRRRYWLASPVEVPAGSRIEAMGTPPPDYIDLTGAQLMKTYPLQVAVDYVSPR